VCGRVGASCGELSVVFLRITIRRTLRFNCKSVGKKSVREVAGVFDSENVISFCAAWLALKVSVEA
jgi:hypothetical protein